MSVMSIGETAPPDRPLTVEDLERMPDDGRRYELADGRLDVSPAPSSLHSVVEGRLIYHLTASAPRGRYTIAPNAGINFNADRTHHRIPDVSVFRREDYEKPSFPRPPVLAIEVLSPESTFRDNHTKRREYAEFGIESYWIVNPSEDKPGIIAFRLHQGIYREVAQVNGEDVFTAEAPFPVSVVPYWLVDQTGPWEEHIGGPGPAEEEG